ncbi:MAG: 3-oxoacyl-ACP synthase III [Opitutaceae bacterium]
MRFSNLVIESIAAAEPPEVLTSDQIEERLRPLYERLKLPFGRLELMTGIRERRFWPADHRPSAASAEAAEKALARSRIPREKIEVLVHAAVCRDMLEPATAAFVHRALGLSPECQVFDLSNACLGFLNAIVLLGSMIESGQIRCGMIVVGENGRPLIEQTLGELLAKPLTRNGIKPYFANLTIGSAGCAAILCHRDLAPDAPQVEGGICRAASEHSGLCLGDAAGHGLAMQTESEALLEAGVTAARQTWEAFKAETGWTESTPDRIICHQVGSVHRRRLYETLALDPDRDFSTFEVLGNTGSAALPVTLNRAVEAGAIKPGDRVALLGIGSGINCLMLAIRW